LRSLFQKIAPFNRKLGWGAPAPVPSFVDWRRMPFDEKHRCLVETWGPREVPTELVYGMDPLDFLPPDDREWLMQQFRMPDVPSVNIFFRSGPVEPDAPVTVLVVRGARVLLPEVKVSERVLPLFQAMHRLPGGRMTKIDFRHPPAPRR